MAGYPAHYNGTTALLKVETIATFPVGSFLENIAVRSNGSLLVSDMLGGTIHYLDPNAPDTQSTVKKVHEFVSPATEATESQQVGEYGSGMTGEAIVEDTRTIDVFYTFSGRHGKAGTWAVYRLNMCDFERNKTVNVEKLADVPQAMWLNGATFIPGSSKLILAESALGQLICCDVDAGTISIWAQHDLLGKVTDRPPWPAVNGVQYFKGHVYVTNSDRAMLLKAKVDLKTGNFVKESLEVVAENLAGDDLAFDVNGSAYVTTNPQNTVVKLPGAGLGRKESERLTIAGTGEQAEAAGPTAAAFGRTAKDRSFLYVVTTGGLVVPMGDGPGPGRVLRVDVGVNGEA